MKFSNTFLDVDLTLYRILIRNFVQLDVVFNKFAHCFHELDMQTYYEL